MDYLLFYNGKTSTGIVFVQICQRLNVIITFTNHTILLFPALKVAGASGKTGRIQAKSVNLPSAIFSVYDFTKEIHGALHSEIWLFQTTSSALCHHFYPALPRHGSASHSQSEYSGKLYQSIHPIILCRILPR
jgi:hypothetical protein